MSFEDQINKTILYLQIFYPIYLNIFPSTAIAAQHCWLQEPDVNIGGV